MTVSLLDIDNGWRRGKVVPSKYGKHMEIEETSTNEEISNNGAW